MIYSLSGDDDFTIRETLAGMKESVGTPDVRDVNIVTLGADVSLDEFTANGLHRAVSGGQAPGAGGRTARQVRARGRPPLRLRREREEGPRGVGATPGRACERARIDGRGVRRRTPQRIEPAAQADTEAGYCKNVQSARPPRASDVDRRPRAERGSADRGAGRADACRDHRERPAGHRVGASQAGPRRFRRAIAAEDVDRMVSYAQESNIFASVDAIVEGRVSEALGLSTGCWREEARRDTSSR